MTYPDPEQERDDARGGMALAAFVVIAVSVLALGCAGAMAWMVLGGGW